jgi:hypothetical protein
LRRITQLEEKVQIELWLAAEAVRLVETERIPDGVRRDTSRDMA